MKTWCIKLIDTLLCAREAEATHPALRRRDWQGLFGAIG
jgi:hypothetical protein